MNPIIASPATAYFLGIPMTLIYLLIPIISVGTFAYIIATRLHVMVKAAPDFRLDNIPLRIKNVFKYFFGQYRHPRYLLIGIIHIMLFSGFIILFLRSMNLVLVGIQEGAVLPGLGGTFGYFYNVLKDIAGTTVLIAALAGIIRHKFYRPARYNVPPRYGRGHAWEAFLVLSLILTLVVADMLFEGSNIAAYWQQGIEFKHFILPLTGTWFAAEILQFFGTSFLQHTHYLSYFIHEITFFFFLCFLPLGKHFHVILAIFNVFFMKLKKGSVKPVRWDVSDNELDSLESFGVKYLEDFTWKHILDFYSCVDCGRCSDNCPATAVGRPLSPRFISIKCRDYSYKKYPLIGKSVNHSPLIGHVLEEDEIWSCTTCGACEEECPVLIEYIDKVVDVRRGMVEDGLVPQSMQKPLGALEKRGNPYGKMEKKRAEWTLPLEKEEGLKIKILSGKKADSADTLFFVDSVTSFDDRIQEIGRSSARVMKSCGVDFGILGAVEKDSGHEVRRFGEEMLFQELRDQNTEAILASKASRIVTADPHAYNALKKDYKDLPSVEHISQVLARKIREGRIRLNPLEDGKIYTYHDPCYLGRHNEIYDAPREVLDAIPGMKRVEMKKSRDRSFCCGGGGLMLFYEPIEETRMGKLRVEMAHKAGANVIVTACPFCMVNIEDGIKISGLEGKIEAIDLVELIDRQRVK